MKRYDFDTKAVRMAVEVLADFTDGDEQGEAALEYLCTAIEDLHRRAVAYDDLHADLQGLPEIDSRSMGFVIRSDEVDGLSQLYDHEPVAELDL